MTPGLTSLNDFLLIPRSLSVRHFLVKSGSWSVTQEGYGNGVYRAILFIQVLRASAPSSDDVERITVALISSLLHLQLPGGCDSCGSLWCCGHFCWSCKSPRRWNHVTQSNSFNKHFLFKFPSMRHMETPSDFMWQGSWRATRTPSESWQSETARAKDMALSTHRCVRRSSKGLCHEISPSVYTLRQIAMKDSPHRHPHVSSAISCPDTAVNIEKD